MTRRVFWIVAVLMPAAKSVVPKEPHPGGTPVGARLVLGASPTIDSSAG